MIYRALCGTVRIDMLMLNAAALDPQLVCQPAHRWRGTACLGFYQDWQAPNLIHGLFHESRVDHPAVTP